MSHPGAPLTDIVIIDCAPTHRSVSRSRVIADAHLCSTRRFLILQASICLRDCKIGNNYISIIYMTYAMSK